MVGLKFPRNNPLVFGNSSARRHASLESICRAYWYPLYAYARRCGQPPHDAQDFTREFFHRLLENAGSTPPIPGKAVDLLERDPKVIHPFPTGSSSNPPKNDFSSAVEA